MYVFPTNFTDARIGFTPESYTVNEEGGTVILTVSVLSGMLQRPVEISFNTATTSNDPATGIVCCVVLLTCFIEDMPSLKPAI